MACALCWAALGAGVVATLGLAWVLRTPPQVPSELPGWPSLGFLYLQLVRSALLRKKPSGKGKPIQVPASYPIVECFRLSMLAMSHMDFPFNVLGAVLARNAATVARPIGAEEALTYSTSVDPDFVVDGRGDTEIRIVSTATDAAGAEVWRNVVTVIVINPKRQRGGAKKAGEAAPEPPARELLAELRVPADAGRAYGALSGDRNPIHIHALTSQLFGFKRPIAHALYLVARLEAALHNAGRMPREYPLTYETEFKRPTTLPATLQAVAAPGVQPAAECAVLTGDGQKEVIVGRVRGGK